MSCKCCGQEINPIVDQYRDDDNKLHREDGPAFESFISPYKAWYIHGKLHRVDGPAIIDCYEDELYYVNGKLHREDGPAVCYYSKDQFDYYLDGEKIAKKDLEDKFPV
jgi:hypothetical protein